ncbi:hypothetical protein G4W71_09065 [Clostridium botulinum]|uniref:hypothetical protein n=1 Tax=Clostridium botulinum TaxID=1491 RepID=UPI001788B8A9|nr:hypothetical protein [Clostridium botulinum]MBE1304168.1 hypothetical protein [Clostridium botulinum]
MDLLDSIGIAPNINEIEQNIFVQDKKICNLNLIYDDKIEDKSAYFWENYLKEQISYCNL